MSKQLETRRFENVRGPFARIVGKGVKHCEMRYRLSAVIRCFCFRRKTIWTLCFARTVEIALRSACAAKRSSTRREASRRRRLRRPQKSEAPVSLRHTRRVRETSPQSRTRGVLVAKCAFVLRPPRVSRCVSFWARSLRRWAIRRRNYSADSKPFVIMLSF